MDPERRKLLKYIGAGTVLTAVGGGIGWAFNERYGEDEGVKPEMTPTKTRVPVKTDTPVSVDTPEPTNTPEPTEVVAQELEPKYDWDCTIYSRSNQDHVLFTCAASASDTK